MMQTYNNPATPFVWPIQGGLRGDFNILVSGTPQQGNRFAINLKCGPGGEDAVAFHFNPRFDRTLFSINLKCGPGGDDANAFHFNPRFDENQVVRNTMKAGQAWGNEERQGPFPFNKKCRFDLAILVQPTMYRVSVNGQHFCDYKHRIPLNHVSYIHISNGVSIDRVSIDLPPPPAYSAESCMLAPLYNPPMPFNQKIGGLYCGRMIYISAIPKSAASRFSINLYAGSDVAFHFDARFAYGNDRQVLVRNSNIGNRWGQEERQASHFPFVPDMYFDMIILVDPTCFKVAVNNSHLLTYCHRYQPLDRIDTLSIGNDIRLCHIRFQ